MVYEASDLVTIVKKGGRAEVAWMASRGGVWASKGSKICLCQIEKLFVFVVSFLADWLHGQVYACLL